MAELIVTLILMEAVIVTVWDVLGVPGEIASGIASLITRGRVTTVTLRKPFGCSLCLTFWVSLAVMLVTQPVTFGSAVLYTAVSLALAFSTNWMLLTINTVNKLVLRLLCLTDRLVSKIR